MSGLKNIKLIFLFVNLLSINFYGFSQENKIDVLDYTINIRIDNFTGKIITGKTDLRLVSKERTDKIKLYLLDFQITGITVNGRENGKYFQKGENLIILLEKSATVFDTLNISVSYKGKTQEDKSWGGFFWGKEYAFNIGVGMSANPQSFGRAWFPCNDVFEDKARYKYNITVPEDYIAVCSGGFVEQKKENGFITYSYIQNKEISSYLSSFAVGKYEVLRMICEGISRKIPIEIYVVKDLLKNTENSFSNLPKCIHGFEKKYGEYMWERVGYVGVNFRSGAMEHVCNIAYPEYAIDGTHKHETLYAHELSHSWFGNYVTCKTAGDMWLNEGWARFSEAVFLEEVYGEKKYKDYIRTNHEKVLQTTHLSDGGYYALAGVPHSLTYSSTVYNKGADVVHTLRKYLGDSIFFATTKAYLNKFAYKSASTEDLKNFFSEYSGADLTDFFNSWVYTKGFPAFEISDFDYTKKENKFTVNFKITQKHKERDIYSSNNRLEISFFDKNLNRYDTTVIFSGKEENKIFEIDIEPTSVFLDLEEKISDASVSNYKIVSSSEMYDFENTNFRFYCKTLEDKSVINSIFYYIPADKTGNNSVSISGNCYWNISKTSGNMSGDGLFYVNTGVQGFDKNVEELKLYYRKNSNEVWEKLNFQIKRRDSQTAWFVVENFKFGEYCLGE